jgi:hypothetical protein
MRIAILSDTHSRYYPVETALRLLEREAVDLILHCGDIEDGEAVKLFPAKTHFVFGNCDHDRDELRQAMAETGATLHEPYGSLELPGGKVAFLHGDDRRLMQDVENSGYYDYLFYGHTHHAAEHRTGSTRVINPGALHRARPKTFVVLDLETGKIESVTVEE